MNMEDVEIQFTEGWEMMQAIAHALSRRNGFWPEVVDQPIYERLAKLALIHSEVSEALEAARKPGTMDKHLPERPAEAVELADIILRVMDYAEAYNLPVAECVIEKHDFNSRRPYKHGKAA